MAQTLPMTSTSTPRSMAQPPTLTRLAAVVALLCGAGLVFAGCHRPLVVTESAFGAELLPLTGEQMVTGVTTRALRFGPVELAKGTKLRVGETWLVRKSPGDPPSYRIKGYYDLAVRSDGFVLPARSVNVFFNALIGPAFQKNVPVPKEAFQRD